MDGSARAIWAAAACSAAVVRAVISCTNVILSEGRDVASAKEAHEALYALERLEQRMWVAIGGDPHEAVD